MASRQATVANGAVKADISFSSAGSASNNVIIAFDNAMNPNDVVVLIEKIKEKILEQEY